MKTHYGFTLIELLLVISFMLILGTMMTSFTARLLTQSNVYNASDQIIEFIRQAQINAMVGKRNSNWGVDFASSTITLYQGPSFAGRTSALDQKISVAASIAITAFDDNFWKRTGTPSGFTTPQTITITGNGSSKQITINAQGMATR